MMQHEYSKSYLLGEAALKKARELAAQEDSKVILSVTFKDRTTLEIWSFLDKYYVIQLDTANYNYSLEEVAKDYADNMETMLKGSSVLFGGF